MSSKRMPGRGLPSAALQRCAEPGALLAAVSTAFGVVLGQMGDMAAWRILRKKHLLINNSLEHKWHRMQYGVKNFCCSVALA